MRISLNTSNRTPRWYDNLWASLMFFTRLPFWRLHQPPAESFQCVVEYWPLAGWLTGGAMAAVLWAGDMLFPHMLTVVLAIVVRILLTGALHEDGLADCFDGFGGGTSRERTLLIMKDSHIGTYGVLGLTLYLALLFTCLYSLPPAIAPLVVLAADPYSKLLAAQATMMMPYARTADEAKARVVYRRMSITAGLRLFVMGVLPLALLLGLASGVIAIDSCEALAVAAYGLRWHLLVFVPGIAMYALYIYIYRRLRGYTGDCCGAMCLLIELAFLLTAVATC